MQPKALYICYFGLREPLVQTQVLPYLRELAKDNYRLSLLTFEPSKEAAALRSGDAPRLKAELAEQGIDWHWRVYHKRFSVIATAYDILHGALFVWRFIGREKVDLLHCRVHLPALMAAIARKLSRHRPKMLFDIRGFFPEEYTDAGIWPEGGWLYRSAKRAERWLLNEADGFVVLTEKARDILFPESVETGFDKRGRPVEVIPCCVDLKRFEVIPDESRAEMRRELEIGNRFAMAYVGSFGGWYLTREMFDFFAAAREADPSVFVMVLTQRDKAMVTGKLKAAGFANSDFFVDSVLPEDLPRYLNAADVGVSFIKPCISKQASSPTKNAEYLASGLPIIANSGVGDVYKLITETPVGVLIDRFESESYIDAVKEILLMEDIAHMCRKTARRCFDLETVGGERYRRLYEKILA